MSGATLPLRSASLPSRADVSLVLSLADWEKRLGELQKDNAELREQSEQLQVLLKDVSTD
eukprot:COSAG01_NODE_56336_length_319_cov_0.681818_1_plen_59_part_10